MTKKKSSEILADESREIFREKVKVWNFFENRGDIWNRGENASWPQRGWTPLITEADDNDDNTKQDDDDDDNTKQDDDDHQACTWAYLGGFPIPGSNPQMNNGNLLK